MYAPNAAAQRYFVACVNEPLRSCGVELRETGSEGGYPPIASSSSSRSARRRCGRGANASAHHPGWFSSGTDAMLRHPCGSLRSDGL